jgi:hypothetical protein
MGASACRGAGSCSSTCALHPAGLVVVGCCGLAMAAVPLAGMSDSRVGLRMAGGGGAGLAGVHFGLQEPPNKHRCACAWRLTAYMQLAAVVQLHQRW